MTAPAPGVSLFRILGTTLALKKKVDSTCTSVNMVEHHFLRLWDSGRMPKSGSPPSMFREKPMKAHSVPFHVDAGMFDSVGAGCLGLLPAPAIAIVTPKWESRYYLEGHFLPRGRI